MEASISDIAQGDGFFFGSTHLFPAKLTRIGITIIVSAAGTFICYGITCLFGKIRVEEIEKRSGLDTTEHGEKAHPSFTGLD